MGVGADHRHARQRLHDKLLDGRRHVAGGAGGKEAGGSAELELYLNGIRARYELNAH